jgi:hypothetical protein
MRLGVGVVLRRIGRFVSFIALSRRVVMKLNQKKAQKSGSRHRLEAYLAAGLGSCGLASSAQAAVVTLDLTKAGSNQVDITGVNGGAAFTFGRNAYDFFLPGNRLTALNNFYFNWGISGSYGLELGTLGAKASPQAFSQGDNIGSSTSTAWRTGFYNSSFKVGVTESPAFNANTYMAMRSKVGADYYYGWIEVTWDPTLDQFRLISAAYEDTPNTAILAGDTSGGPAPVPEPASSAVVALLMGGAALRKWRKSKNKQDAQEPSSESLAS